VRRTEVNSKFGVAPIDRTNAVTRESGPQHSCWKLYDKATRTAGANGKCWPQVPARGTCHDGQPSLRHRSNLGGVRVRRRFTRHGLERENRVGLGEIRRISRREISQAGRDAFACARFSFWARFNFLVHPAGSRKYGGVSCNPSVMRSYFAPAWRASADAVRQPGAVRRTRGARAPHSGQADGSSHSAIARTCVNGPHFLHIYSYVGIDHLPAA